MKNRQLVTWGIIICLCTTCSIGMWLRWNLTNSWGLGNFSFVHLKHAHSHLGYFGIVFSLLFVAWKKRGSFTLSYAAQFWYAFGVALSTFGFARAGYKLDAIIGSSIVGLFWLIAAWEQRTFDFRKAQWMSIVPIGILLASCCIPPIAIFTKRNPLLGQLFVKTFLSSLIFLVAIPTILERLRVPPPISGIWLLSGLAGSLFLGILPHPLMGLGLVVMALVLQWNLTFSARQSNASSPTNREQKLTWTLWFFWSFGTITLGIKLIPNQHHIAISGTHFTILGPFLLSAWWLFAPQTMKPLLYIPYLFFVLVMSSTIAMQQYSSHFIWPIITAISGTSITIMTFIFGFLMWKNSARQPKEET